MPIVRQDVEMNPFLGYSSGTVWTILRSTDGSKAHAAAGEKPLGRDSGKTRRTA
jgi:hypothetical protein